MIDAMRFLGVAGEFVVLMFVLFAVAYLFGDSVKIDTVAGTCSLWLALKMARNDDRMSNQIQELRGYIAQLHGDSE